MARVCEGGDARAGAGHMNERDIITPSVDKRVSSELAFHIEMRTRELIESGMTPDDARREAVRRFGDLGEVSADLVKIGKQTDDIMRRTRFFAESMHDAQSALRILARRRGFAALAIGTLALGIGAATAIYSVVDGVLLRPLPFDDPDRIATVWITQPSLANDPAISRYATATPVGNEEYQALRRDAKSLHDIALYSGGFVTLTTDVGSERIPSLTATSSLFSVLRTRAALGPRVHARRQRPEWSARHDVELGNMAVALRRRFVGDRPARHAERHSISSHRRAAARPARRQKRRGTGASLAARASRFERLGRTQEQELPRRSRASPRAPRTPPPPPRSQTHCVRSATPRSAPASKCGSMTRPVKRADRCSFSLAPPHFCSSSHV